jgi:ketosteroid isomerase-like protein
VRGGDVVRRLWELFEARRWDEAGELLTEDFVSEWPHSNERIRGRNNYIELNRNYPQGWTIVVDRIVDAGDVVVSEITVTQDEQVFNAAAIFELRDGKLARAREYWVEAGSEFHPERSRWAEPMG